VLETLLLVAERDGPEMMARTGMMWALNRLSARRPSQRRDRNGPTLIPSRHEIRPLLSAGPAGLADASNRSGRHQPRAAAGRAKKIRRQGQALDPRSRKQKDPDQQTCCKCPEA
jgi:hypothetical protein